ncbi:MAG TPA: NAD(P)-binding domain-containing protein, partial [Chloroflexota bacterium]|nr:NAD(P)-binding domain-containing protein [Chloroflexota bacterium]
MNVKEELLQKIAERRAKIAVIGMGYVGLPLMVAFAEAGFPVVGVDVDRQKVEMLNRGESYIEDVTDEMLGPLVQKGVLWASSDYTAVADVDAISICVPTPLRKTKDPDISYIINAADNIAAHDGKGKLIVLESTT